MRVQLSKTKTGKLEFHERQFANEVRVAHGLEPEEYPQVAYNPSEEWIEFTYEVDEKTVKGVYRKFKPDKTYHWTRDTKRMVELLDKDDLTDEEDQELKKLHRKWLRHQLGPA